MSAASPPPEITEDDTKVMQDMLKKLAPLTEETRTRILRTVCMFFRVKTET